MFFLEKFLNFQKSAKAHRAAPRQIIHNRRKLAWISCVSLKKPSRFSTMWKFLLRLRKPYFMARYTALETSAMRAMPSWSLSISLVNMEMV